LNIIKTLSKNLKTPFSIKSRTGLNEEDKKAQMNFLIEASNFCHMITIHARTLKELYSGD
jgi:tRNA-dihydrouridine synthase